MVLIWKTYPWYWTVGFKKSSRKEGAAFAENWPQAQSFDNFDEVVQPQSGRIIMRVMSIDETWIHHHIAETKQQSLQWVSLSKAPKKVKVGLSTDKIIA